MARNRALAALCATRRRCARVGRVNGVLHFARRVRVHGPRPHRTGRRDLTSQVTERRSLGGSPQPRNPHWRVHHATSEQFKRLEFSIEVAEFARQLDQECSWNRVEQQRSRLEPEQKQEQERSRQRPLVVQGQSILDERRLVVGSRFLVEANGFEQGEPLVERIHEGIARSFRARHRSRRRPRRTRRTQRQPQRAHGGARARRGRRSRRLRPRLATRIAFALNDAIRQHEETGGDDLVSARFVFANGRPRRSADQLPLLSLASAASCAVRTSRSSSGGGSSAFMPRLAIHSSRVHPAPW